MNNQKMSKKCHIREIEFGTPEYDESVKLRFDILRKPLNLNFNTKDLSSEYDSIHLGAYDDNAKLIGCLILQRYNERQLKMRQVAVDKSMQGKGIGSAMLQYSEQLAKEKEFVELMCHARKRAVAFYLNHDYKIDSDEFIEVGIPHFRMVKKIQ